MDQTTLWSLILGGGGIGSVVAFIKFIAIPIKHHYEDKLALQRQLEEDRNAREQKYVDFLEKDAAERVKDAETRTKINDTLDSLRVSIDQLNKTTTEQSLLLNGHTQMLEAMKIRIEHGEENIKNLQSKCNEVKEDVSALNVKVFGVPNQNYRDGER